MVLVTQNNLGGLGEAIQQVGSSFGQAIHQRKQNALQEALRQSAMQAVGENSTLGQLLSQPRGLQVAQQLIGVLGPILKEETKKQGVQSFFNQFQDQTKEDFSPIQIAKMRPQMEVEEGEYIQTPQGSFGEEEVVDVPGFGKFPREMISQALSNPNEQVRRWGEGAQKALEAKESQQRKRFESDREYHRKGTEKAEESVRGLREALPRKESALSLARNAVESGDVGRLSKANLAQIFPGAIGKLFQTAQGAQLVTAGKENLLSNMSRVSARAQNQWFEQRLNSMFPQIGQSEEANLTTQEMLEGELALEKAYLDAYDKIAHQEEKEFGFIRRGIDRKARQTIKPLEQQIFDRTMFRIKQIQEQQEGLPPLNQLQKKVAKGTPLTPAMARLMLERYGDVNTVHRVATKLGYDIPTDEELNFYTQSFREIGE